MQPLILRPKLEADTEPADLEDDLVYADSDYRDLYAYGPVSYTQTSRHAAQTKKEEIAKRYGTIGRKYNPKVQNNKFLFLFNLIVFTW